MRKVRGPIHVVLTPSAQSDIREALTLSHERFGSRAAERYRDLIKQALSDIVADPERPGSAERRELARGIRSSHLFFSRERAPGTSGIVARPRHFLIYRWRDENTIDVLRLLHDARDIERNLPESYLRDLEDPGM